MVTICCFSRSNFNNHLIMTHLCSNEWISRIKSITLFNARDFVNYESWALLPSVWKQRHYFMVGGSFWPSLLFMFLCWNWSESDPKKTWALGAVTLWWFYESFKQLGIVINKSIWNRHVFCVWAGCPWALLPSVWKQRHYFMVGGSFWPSLLFMFLCWNWSESDPKKTWALGAVTLWWFYESFKQLGIVINKSIWNRHVFCVWAGYRFSFNNVMWLNYFQQRLC